MTRGCRNRDGHGNSCEIGATNVRFRSKAEFRRHLRDVRYPPESKHQAVQIERPLRRHYRTIDCSQHVLSKVDGWTLHRLALPSRRVTHSSFNLFLAVKECVQLSP